VPLRGEESRRCHLAHSPAELDSRASLAQSPTGRISVELLQRNRWDRDVGRVRVVEQAGAKDLDGREKRRLVGVEVERRECDQVPERRDGALGLAVGAKPAAERLRVEAAILRIERLQRPCRARGSDPLRQREVPVAKQRRCEMQRGGQRRPLENGLAAPWNENGDPEAGLDLEQVLDADPAQEHPVRAAAAKRDVLTVVHPVPVPSHGERRTAEPAP
jgi:hypothetical protein